MLKEIEQLLILQDRDKKLRALKQELKTAPLERKQFEERLAAATKQLEVAKFKGKETEVERKKLENDVLSKREQIAKYQGQKFQTRKNEEFQAFSTAITHLETDIRTIEDKELELMESAEVQKGVIAESEKQFAEVKAQVARQLANLDEKIAAIQTQLTTLETERANLASEVEEDLLDTYNRLFASKHDQAIVGLEHGICSGCHMKVTPTTNAKTKASKEVTNCEYCGRILFWAE